MAGRLHHHGDKSRARRGWVESRAQSDSKRARPKKRAFLLLFDDVPLLAWPSVQGVRFVIGRSLVKIQPSAPELKMLRWAKPEARCKRQDRPHRICVFTPWQVGCTNIMATNPGSGG